MAMSAFMKRAAAMALLLVMVPTAADSSPVREPHWTEAFGLSPAALLIKGMQAPQISATVRFSVRVAVGGSGLRLRISNEIGTQPVVVDAVTIARALKDRPNSAVGAIPVTFAGRTSISIAAGTAVVTDTIPIKTKAFDDLTVSVYSAKGLPISPLGAAAMTLAPGDQTAKVELDGSRPLIGRPVVSAVLVATPESRPVIVAFGDSLTDGARKNPGDLRGYPEGLARRLASGSSRLVVVNAGIGGNRVLSDMFGASAQARLDRDALRLNDLRYMIFLEGINDIGSSGATKYPGPVITADDLIAGYRQVITRAHVRGIKIIGATLLPFRGADYFSEEREQIRVAVNQWIRTSGEYDAIIDFDVAVRDPSDPSRYRPDFDSGDHLHPNNKGYQAMADAIDLRLFH